MSLNCVTLLYNSVEKNTSLPFSESLCNLPTVLQS